MHVKQIDDWQEGFYSRWIKSQRLWAPVKIWLEDGDRNEQGGLDSDQLWRASWAPHPSNAKFYPLTMNEELWISVKPITKDEFEWLIALKQL